MELDGVSGPSRYDLMYIFMTIPGDIISMFGRLSVSRRAFVFILYDYRNLTTIPTFPILPSRSRFSTYNLCRNRNVSRHPSSPCCPSYFYSFLYMRCREVTCLTLAQTLRGVYCSRVVPLGCTQAGVGTLHAKEERCMSCMIVWVSINPPIAKTRGMPRLFIYLYPIEGRAVSVLLFPFSIVSAGSTIYQHGPLSQAHPVCCGRIASWCCLVVLWALFLRSSGCISNSVVQFLLQRPKCNHGSTSTCYFRSCSRGWRIYAFFVGS